jgi:hypothetical protein
MVRLNCYTVFCQNLGMLGLFIIEHLARVMFECVKMYTLGCWAAVVIRSCFVMVQHHYVLPQRLRVMVACCNCMMAGCTAWQHLVADSTLILPFRYRPRLWDQ